jgi:MFS family permease
MAGTIALMFNRIPYQELEAVGISENLNYIISHYPDLLNTWRYPFLYLGIFALITTTLNLLFTTEPKRAAKEKSLEKILAENNFQYKYKIKISDLKLILTKKSNFFLIMNFFDVVASGLLVAFLFPYLNLEMGISFGDPFGLLAIIVLLLFIVPLGFVIGQFGFAHLGDKKVQHGDLSGRIKIATICGILNIPFLLFAFYMSPKVSNLTFFFGSLIVDYVGFWILWVIFSSFLGIGLAFTFGIAPNWYSSLVDVNLPEHRGTMIAMASFIDTIGRAFGAILGGFIITATNMFSLALFWSTLIFGILSTCFWIPLFFTCNKDLKEITETLKNRAEKIKKEHNL